MTSFNLSDWALRHKSFVVYLMLAAAIAGVMAYGKLGREEDPPFTIKTMVVKTLWPGATTTDTINQVTDRIEKKLEELPYLDYVQQLHQARRVRGVRQSQGHVRAADGARPLVPGAQEDRRHPRRTCPPASTGPTSTTSSATPIRMIYALTADGFIASRAAGLCRARARRAAARARRRQGRPDRRAGREDLSRVLHPADGGARHRRQRADAGAAGAECGGAERARRCRARAHRHPRLRRASRPRRA